MEGLMFEAIKSICLIVMVSIIGLGFRFYGGAAAEQQRARRRLKGQGVLGPPPAIFHGGNTAEMKRIQAENIVSTTHSDIIGHDYTSSIFPYFEHWRKQYGRVYTYSTGWKQHLYMNDPELVKELNVTNTMDLGKVSYVAEKLRPILGRGVITSNGPHWAYQRRVIAPEFFMNKVKGMVGLIVESTMPMLKRWEEMMMSAGEREGMSIEIRVDEELREVSADVISRACFGSSFAKGKEIFSRLRSLQKALTRKGTLFSLEGFSDMAAIESKKHEEMGRRVETLIWETVQRREEERTHGKDLLQLILEGARGEGDTKRDEVSYKSFVVDNCKNIYFAGHETTAVAASWCLMLLALNPVWQNRIRDEVLRVCKNGIPDSESIAHLKTVTMVIQETLRLYPPAAFVSRQALADTKLGSLDVPKGVCIWTLIPTLHRDPEIWGQDSNEFRPERFREGVSRACKYAHAFAPFGLGTRLCLGKNLGMVELKVLVSLIVSRFSFTLSPSYQHSPVFRMLVEPQHGVLLRLSRAKSYLEN